MRTATVSEDSKPVFTKATLKPSSITVASDASQRRRSGFSTRSRRNARGPRAAPDSSPLDISGIWLDSSEDMLTDRFVAISRPRSETKTFCTDIWLRSNLLNERLLREEASCEVSDSDQNCYYTYSLNTIEYTVYTEYNRK